VQSTIRKGLDNMAKTLRETLSAIYEDYKKHNLTRVKVRVVKANYKLVAMVQVNNFEEDILDDWAMNMFVKENMYTGQYELIILED
jgi:GTP cyclohydrolase I